LLVAASRLLCSCRVSLSTRIVAGLGVLVSTASAASDGEPSRITDGAADSTTAVVGILASDDALARPYCTGTLIAPTLVVTAAHCVTASGPTHVDVGGERIEVAGTERAPTFDPTGLTDDIAVLYLATVASVAPIRIGRATDALRVGAMVRIVGYGRTSAEQPADGERRSGYAQIAELAARDFVIVAAPAQTCFGDSGGPALMALDGHYELVGVASSGDAACEERGRFVRVEPFRELLDTQPSITAGCASGGSTDFPIAIIVIAVLIAHPRRGAHRC
jgi:secreted trypsin-like serine protease